METLYLTSHFFLIEATEVSFYLPFVLVLFFRAALNPVISQLAFVLGIAPTDV